MAKDRVDRDEEDLVRLYLSDIGQYTLLTKDDEVRLAKQIEAGKTAREEFGTDGKGLTPAKKRELRNLIKDGETAERAFCSRANVSPAWTGRRMVRPVLAMPRVMAWRIHHVA